MTTALIFGAVGSVLGWLGGMNYGRYTLPKWEREQEQAERDYYEKLKHKYEGDV